MQPPLGLHQQLKGVCALGQALLDDDPRKRKSVALCTQTPPMHSGDMTLLFYLKLIETSLVLQASLQALPWCRLKLADGVAVLAEGTVEGGEQEAQHIQACIDC